MSFPLPDKLLVGRFTVGCALEGVSAGSSSSRSTVIGSVLVAPFFAAVDLGCGFGTGAVDSPVRSIISWRLLFAMVNTKSS